MESIQEHDGNYPALSSVVFNFGERGADAFGAPEYMLIFIHFGIEPGALVFRRPPPFTLIDSDLLEDLRVFPDKVNRRTAPGMAITVYRKEIVR